jgi:hypothetical protein
MTDNFGSPAYSEPPKKKNTALTVALIILAVLFVITLCCCVSGYLLWTYGDQLLSNLGITY